MILVDTSVWIKHAKSFDPKLAELLHEWKVYCHFFVVGELAIGSIKNREIFLEKLNEFPKAERVGDKKVLEFIETNKLYATGLSYIDIHLLASCVVTKCKLYTLDNKLADFAAKMGINY
jgi:predicted nucleic acid-binding protein